MANLRGVVRAVLIGVLVTVVVGQYNNYRSSRNYGNYGGRPHFRGRNRFGGGRPSFRGGNRFGGNPYFARGGARGVGVPGGNGRGNFAVQQRFRNQLVNSFGPQFAGAYAAFQPGRGSGTTTPKPKAKPLTDKQKKMVKSLVEVIYQNHEKRLHDEKKNKELDIAGLTPEEKHHREEEKRIKSIMDAASLFNAKN